MCQRCSESSGNPRDAAFQTFPFIESLSIKESNKVVAGLPAYVVIEPFQNAGEAKFRAYTMQQDPKLRAVKLTAQTVCLN